MPTDTAGPRLVHIGLGAFARAHTLACLDTGNSAAGTGWRAVVARLNSGRDLLEALDRDGGRYLLLEADGEGVHRREIGVIASTCHPARDGAGALPALIAAPETATVTLTITEKGYCLRAGRLDPEHPAIRADLAAPEAPGSAVGVLVQGLALRRAAGLGGLTVMSCDNLPSNGRLCAAAVQDFAALRDQALADWIAHEVRFPCAMVDRIVPAPDDAARALLAAEGGAPDTGVVCEPFLQWVIEDDFAGPRPPLDLGGAQFVADVAPFELMKLRMLNGTHSFLAFLGSLSGHRTVADCMGDARLRRAARALMAEAAASLPPVPGTDTEAYAEALLARFANPRLQHALAQIATDSSQKVPQRLLMPASEHIAAGRPWPMTALALAGWAACIAEGGPRVALADPLADRLRDAHAAGGPEALLAVDAVVPPALAADPAFRAGFAAACNALQEGPAAALDAALAHTEEAGP